MSAAPPVKDWILQSVKIADRGHDTPCWLWLGPLTEKGYARSYIPLGLQVAQSGTRQRIHRFAYHHLVAAVPNHLVCDHLCRVRSCCNPSHIEIVTNGENTRRIPPERKARHGGSFRKNKATHCSNGHEFTPENIFISRSPTRSWRRCRICAIQVSRDLRARARARTIERERATPT